MKQQREIKLTDKLVLPVMKNHFISREEAEKRLMLLHESSIMEHFNPDNLEDCQMVDDFLSLDSSQSSSKVLFQKTLDKCIEDKEFVATYDKLKPKAHMAFTLQQIEGNKMNVKEQREAERQIAMFSEFVRTTVFERLLNS